MFHLVSEDVVPKAVFVKVSFLALRARKGVFSSVLLKVLLVSGLRREFAFAKYAFVVLLQR